ncbi:MAG: AI-2E family transporter [Bacteroidales bacterium]
MKTSIRTILIILGVIIFMFLLWYFRSIVVYVLVSGVLSVMGRPLVDMFSRIRIRKWNFPRVLSALLTLFVIWGLIALFLYIFIPLLTRQINYLSTIDGSKIVELIEEPVRKIEELVTTINPDISGKLSVTDYIASKIESVLNIEVIQNFMGSMVGILGNMAVAAFSISFITFFFLKDQHLFYESILMWIPDKYVDNVTRALNSIKHLLTRYLIGIVIQSTCIMILITIGMTTVGIDFQQALVMGLIVGILNIIPYVGPWLGFFIVMIMGIATSINLDFSSVVVPLVMYMALVVAVTQLIDNIVFQPVIFSNSVRAHPLEIFIVVLAAGFAAGIPGMLLGIPAYTVLRVFAREFFYGFKAIQKITSSLSDEDQYGEESMVPGAQGIGIKRKRRRKPRPDQDNQEQKVEQ